MLEVADVSVWRGASKVLDRISLRVEEGEIVVLLGANGAGKTSTLMTISGLLRPREGGIRFRADGREHDLARLAPDRIVGLGIAHCPEGRQIFASLSVRENLVMGAFLRRDDAVASDLDRMMDLFPVLAERASMRAGLLSGGEQMMLAIARALMSRPRLLMLDEPSLGLAPQVIDRIFDIIEDIRARGTTVLVVEQNATMALDLADRAYVLETGRITLSGPADKLARDPRVREAYLGLGGGTAETEARA
jgi:branched-chain amino acid transport system ATP-binding protein